MNRGAVLLDSSALAKVYHSEAGAAEVARILSEPNRRVIISRLTLVEIQSVFAIQVRTGEISRDDAEMLRRRLLAQVAAGDFEVFTVSDFHFAAAEQFVIKYGFDYRLRTLDALHLAVAADLRSQGLVSHFVAADKALCDVAALEQFVDPQDH